MDSFCFGGLEEKFMKIAFLSHFDYNLYLFRLPIMKELVKRGHKVFAICPRGKVSDKFENFDITHIDYKIERRSLNPFKELKTLKNIYDHIKALDLDVLHNFTAKPNIYGSVAGDLAKVPVIINTVTGLGSYYILDSKRALFIRSVIERLYKEANKKATAVIFQNSDDMKYFIEKGLSRKNRSYLVRSSGIDTNYFSPVENRNDKAVVLMIARAIWHKGIREFYKMAEILKDENAKFVLVGDVDKGNPSSADENFLRSKNVEWLGHRDDIKELIGKSDIFVLPSYREGVPRTLLEAASMAKPIVATDTVGCREVVREGYNGFLVPVKDAVSLAEKVKVLIEDESLRERFGKNSRELAVKEFDVKIVVEKYLDIYEKLLREKNV